MDEIARTYEPAAWFNDFWTLRDYLVPVNASLPQLDITFTVSSIGQMKWMLYLQMEQSFRCPPPAPQANLRTLLFAMPCTAYSPPLFRAGVAFVHSL